MSGGRAIGLGLVVVLLIVAMQLVPVDRGNPPVDADFETPADVKQILERSCYDCHSNETSWPWYSRIAPLSWLIALDVKEGRRELNFSDWARLGTREQVERMEEALEAVEEGEMPLWYYLPAHPEARITAADRKVLRAWSRRRNRDHDD